MRRAWLLLGFFACGDFKGAAPESDAGDADASAPEAGEIAEAGQDAPVPPPQDAASDAGPDASGDSPADFTCTEPWTKPNRTQAGCAARVVSVIEPIILDTTTMSIAVTSTKTIGIAYNSKLDADQGELHVARFARPGALDADGGVGAQVA